ncbi:MAG: homogentisate 1,2-dioxygenase [Bryobacteraceae bacterium]
MPIYHSAGEIPRKRHQVFRQSSGELYAEELMGNKGFVGISSLVYHLRPPTRIRDVKAVGEFRWEAAGEHVLKPRHFKTASFHKGGFATTDRTPFLYNHDVAMLLAQPDRDEDFYYRNGQADEVVYVSEGEGVFESNLGSLRLTSGDYVVIPRGILHRYRWTKAPRLLIFESKGYVRTPKRYRNEHGQLIESAPYSERDIRRPEFHAPCNEEGEFRLLVKQHNILTEVTLAHHPFDVAGWDGYYYPWAFNIHDFEPRVGRFHLPPPVHQTFEGDGWVICSFCPRPYDFDPQAVPAPYHHSNVMSDEVIYYASAEFMSRKGVEYGSVTLHPDGVPHGPHPGRTEASIGAKSTDELAVMLDTFLPLHASREADAVEDKKYYLSWIEG